MVVRRVKNVGLNSKQRRAILLLVEGHSRQKVAMVVGCSKRQIDRWFRQPAFTEALGKAEKDIIDAITRRLIATGLRAIKVTTQIMESDASATVRLRAADSLLSHLLKLRTLADLEDRLERPVEKIESLEKLNDKSE